MISETGFNCDYTSAQRYILVRFSFFNLYLLYKEFYSTHLSFSSFIPRTGDTAEMVTGVVNVQGQILNTIRGIEIGAYYAHHQVSILQMHDAIYSSMIKVWLTRSLLLECKFIYTGSNDVTFCSHLGRRGWIDRYFHGGDALLLVSFCFGVRQNVRFQIGRLGKLLRTSIERTYVRPVTWINNDRSV